MPKRKTVMPSTAPLLEADRPEEQKTAARNRELRAEKKWTQWQLARISRLSERTIQRIERGGRVGPTAEMALAGALGVDAFVLYEPARRNDVIDFIFLKRIASGSSLLCLGEEGVNVGLEIDPLCESEVELVGDFFERFFFLGAFWNDIDDGERARVCEVFNSKIGELDACGLWLFGCRSREKFLSSETEQQVVRLAIARSDDPRIIQPKSLTEVAKHMCGILVVARRLQPIGSFVGFWRAPKHSRVIHAWAA